MTNFEAFFLVIFGAFSVAAPAPGVAQGAGAKAPLSIQLGAVRLQSASLFDALVAARQRNPEEILFGFVELPSQQQRVSLSLDSATLGEYLGHLTSSFPQYNVAVSSTGIVHIDPRSPSPAEDILRVKVARFEIHGHRAIGDVITHLTLEVPELRALVYPRQGGTVGASVSGGMEPKVDFKASNVTVRELLDMLSLYSAQLSRQPENLPKSGPPPPPVSWKVSFHEDPRAENALGGYPELSTF